MKTVIFKSEKKAKTYRIVSTRDQGVYKKDEVVRVVKTDDINKLMSGSMYDTRAELVN